MPKWLPLTRTKIVEVPVGDGTEVQNESLTYNLPETVPLSLDALALGIGVGEFVPVPDEFVIAAILARDELTVPVPVEAVRITVAPSIIDLVPDATALAAIIPSVTEVVAGPDDTVFLALGFDEFAPIGDDLVSLSAAIVEAVPVPRDEQQAIIAAAPEVIAAPIVEQDLLLGVSEQAPVPQDDIVISAAVSVDEEPETDTGAADTGLIAGEMPGWLPPTGSVNVEDGLGSSAWTTIEAIRDVASGDTARSSATAQGVAVGIFTPSQRLEARDFNLLEEEGGFIPQNAEITSVRFECRGRAEGNSGLGSVTGILVFRVFLGGSQFGPTQSVQKSGAGAGPWTTLAVDFTGTRDAPQTTVSRADLANASLRPHAQVDGSGGLLLSSASGDVAYFRVQVSYRVIF